MRPLDRLDDAEIRLVAKRMQLTLIEVLGPEVGATMYSTDWLCDRVRWHLDPVQCTGEVLVVEVDGQIVGHTIVRVDAAPNGAPLGLFSTIYIAPAHRHQGLAEALLRSGEAWLSAQGMTTFATDTSETNDRLIRLFEKHGYTIVLSVTESRMVRLAKPPGRDRE